MIKPTPSIKLVLILVGVLFVAIFSYASILGESDQAKRVVTNLFLDLRDKHYSSALKHYSADQDKNFSSLDEFIQFHFAFELALLEHYEILDDDNYTVEIKRNGLWVPLFGDDKLKLSVRLVPEADSILPTFDKKEFIDSLLTATRENGIWKIKAIEIEESTIETLYDKHWNSISDFQFISSSESSIVFKPVEIDLAQIELTDKKILIHELTTALEILKN